MVDLVEQERLRLKVSREASRRGTKGHSSRLSSICEGRLESSALPWGGTQVIGVASRFPVSMGSKQDTLRPETRMLKRDMLATQHRLLGPTKRVETPTLIRSMRERLDSRGRSVGPRHMMDKWHLHRDMHL